MSFVVGVDAPEQSPAQLSPPAFSSSITDSPTNYGHASHSDSFALVVDSSHSSSSESQGSNSPPTHSIASNSQSRDSPVTDYLAGMDITRSRSEFAPLIHSMDDFEREIVLMQTQNDISKVACDRIFTILQRNAAVLSLHLRQWDRSFKTARKHVVKLTPPCHITVLCRNSEGDNISLGPRKSYPKTEIARRKLKVIYDLYESRLVDIIAFHCRLHEYSCDPNQFLQFDLGLDGVPESASGGRSLDVLTIRFCHCRSVYTLGVFRPASSGYGHADSVLLKSFIAEYKQLIDGNLVSYQSVRLRYVICDAPKRAKVMSLQSHSGYYSCQYCEVKGQYGSRSVFFPPITHGEPLPPRRTVQTLNAAINALQATDNPDGGHRKGIKGPSLLSAIPHFNCLTCLPQERMHLIDLGVCRRLCKLMFVCPGMTNRFPVRERPVSVAPLNRGLRNVRTFSEASRRMRPFRYGYWKSEEFRNLYMFLWPLVAECLKPAVREVWLLFVFIMRGLFVCEPNFIQDHAHLLPSWHAKFCKVFHKHASSYNIHAFLHVGELRALGPLTSTSAVPHECHYHDMKRHFKPGTSSVGMQAIHDCAVRQLGSHTCRRKISIGPYAGGKTDDGLVFLNNGRLLRVTRVISETQFEGYELKVEPTNFQLMNLDFKTVGAYRLQNPQPIDRTRRIVFGMSEIVGKGVLVRNHVSLLTLDFLRER